MKIIKIVLVISGMAIGLYGIIFASSAINDGSQSDLDAILTADAETQSFFDIFLEIDDIKGESQDNQHKDEIQLDSFHWGEDYPGVVNPKGSKPQIQDFHVVKKVDASSPLLLLHSLNGKHLKDATLTVRRNDPSPFEYLIIKFSDVGITSYEVDGATMNTPTDQISFNFGKIEYQYIPVNEDQNAGDPIKINWNVK